VGIVDSAGDSGEAALSPSDSGAAVFVDAPVAQDSARSEGDGGIRDAAIAAMRDASVPVRDAATDSGLADTGISEPPGSKRLFATLGTYDGALGGLSGADKRCQVSADAAGLGGTWVAWLSDGVRRAPERITGDGPWYEVGTHRRIFNNRAQLSGFPLSVITRNELGGPGSTFYWTGTRVNSVLSPHHCDSWTNNGENSLYLGTIGEGNATPPSARWTDTAEPGCRGKYSLLCLEQ
jgi:Protein of unknown function (DUF1554)